MDEQTRHDKMMNEWNAWREVVKELARLGVDINEQDELTRLLKLWGYCLGELPNYQEVKGKLIEK